MLIINPKIHELLFLNLKSKGNLETLTILNSTKAFSGSLTL